VSLEDLTPDELLERARQTESSAQLIAALAGNPKTRESLQRLIKTIHPGVVIPEIDAKDKVVDDLIKPLTTQLETLQRSILERDARDAVRERRESIKVKYHLSDEEVTQVEALMTAKEDPIPTHDAAARVYLASRQSAPSTPVSMLAPVYSMPEKDIWAPGIGNPVMLNRIAMQEATNAWNDLRAGKVAGLGAARSALMT
jgi:hypothetical protein